jgi:hypothetical protein
VTFDDADIYATALTSSEFQLWEALEYLQTNVTGEGQVLGFNSGGNAYLFQNNGSGDLFIQLTSATLAGLTNNSDLATANYLYVI